MEIAPVKAISSLVENQFNFHVFRCARNAFMSVLLTEFMSAWEMFLVFVEIDLVRID